MKTFIHFFCLILLGSSFLLSCKKKVLKEYPELEGRWETKSMGNDCNEYVLRINSDHSGDFYSATTAGITELSGKVKVKDNVLYFSGNQMTIQTFPTEKEDSLEVCSACECLAYYPYSAYMVMDSVTYYKFK